MAQLKHPPPDLLEYVTCRADENGPELRPENRSLRLFVAGYMLGGDRDALERARDLYEQRRPGLLGKPGRLTLASITAEVLQLAAREAS